MKIAFLVDQFPVVSETFIVNQALGILERGHSVDVLSLRRPNTVSAPVHDEIKAAGLFQRTYYFPQPPMNLPMRALQAAYLTATHLAAYPSPVIRFLNPFGQRYQLKLINIYKALFLLKRGPYDIIHCQFGTVGFEGIRLLRLLDKLGISARLVVSFRGFDISQYIQRTYEDIYRNVFQQAHVCLVNCDFFRQRMLRLGCPPGKALIHRSGLDLEKFPFRVRKPGPHGPIRIATTGRFVEKKGLEYAIRAVAQLINQGYPIVYDIIGDGPLRPVFERIIAELGVDQGIRLLGYQTQKQIIEIFDRSHLFVAPSVTATDGDQDAPINVLKEAMALGLPVVSTFHGGIPELVEDGVNGFLVPERDAAALAEKLRYLIEHPQNWPQLARAGRARVEASYDLRRWNERLIEIYEWLLEDEAIRPHTGLERFPHEPSAMEPSSIQIQHLR